MWTELDEGNCKNNILKQIDIIIKVLICIHNAVFVIQKCEISQKLNAYGIM